MNAVAAVLALVAAGFVLVLLHDIVFLAFAGILLAVAFRGVTDAVRRRLPLPDPLALALVVVAMVLAAAGIAWYAGAVVAGEWQGLQRAVPAALRDSLERLMHSPVGPLLPADPQSLVPSFLSVVRQATGLLTSIVAFLVGLALILFIAVCMAAEPAFYRDGTLALVPRRRRAKVRAIFDDIAGTLQRWLLARLISMTAIAVLSTTGLHLLRIPYAAALGALAGVLAFIPNVGAFLAALPSLTFALAAGPLNALLVIAMYWIAHTIDDFLVIPIAERRIVKLPPALTILVQLALGSTVGILGVALAAPLTAAAIVTARHLTEPESDLRRDA